MAIRQGLCFSQYIMKLLAKNFYSPSQVTQSATLGMQWLSSAVVFYDLIYIVYCKFYARGSNVLLIMPSPPPGPQSNLERWSIVFFTRPGNSVVLRALVDESTMIDDAVAGTPEKKFETGSTALDWFSRRIRNQRINNRKVLLRMSFFIIPITDLESQGPETWMASRGTEQIEV